DQALRSVRSLQEKTSNGVLELLDHAVLGPRMVRVLGASQGLCDFFERHPRELSSLHDLFERPPNAAQYSSALLDAVVELRGDAAIAPLRVSYRRHRARLAAWDLEQPDPLNVVDDVAAALADLAAAALDTSLAIARRETELPDHDVAGTRLAII